MKKTVCTYCGVGCELGFKGEKVVHLKDGVVSKGKLCIKGNFGHEFVKSANRINGAWVSRELLKEFALSNFAKRINDRFFEVPYEVAYDVVAKKLSFYKERFGGSSFAAIGGARTNCESAYLFQKFAREVMNSPNVDNCARICHAPSLKGLRETVGEGAASVPFDFIYDADLIVVIGSNTTEAHPIVAHRIIERVRKGAKLAVVDVREIGLFRFADFKFLIPFESNLLFLNVLLKYIVENKLYDEEFVERRVENFEEFREKVLSFPYSLDVFKRMKGYEYLTEEIKRFAQIIANSKTVFLWGLGVTEHVDGSETVMAIANLGLITGNPYFIPLRGQNNVQGACDMGMLPYFLPGYKKPKENGLTTPEIIDAVLEGKIKALWIMGEDLAHVHPRRKTVEEALSKVDFLVVNELFPCETVKFADVVFGVRSSYEKEGVYINAERRLHLSTPIYPSTLPDDWEVIGEVAGRMGTNWNFLKAEDVWNEVREKLPEIFGGASYEFLRKNFLNSPQWPVASFKGTEKLFENRFNRESGLARLCFSPYKERGMVKELLEGKEGEDFWLTTGRILLHYNNGAQTMNCKTLYKFKTYREDVVYASEEDRGKLKNAEKVKLVSDYGETDYLPLIYSKHIRRGTLFVSFHQSKSGINYLFGSASDRYVKTAAFKALKVKVVPYET